jgi:hypothetical protein
MHIVTEIPAMGQDVAEVDIDAKRWFRKSLREQVLGFFEYLKVQYPLSTFQVVDDGTVLYSLDTGAW